MPLQATSGAASYDAFGGGVAAVPNYIEEVFATHLYTGNQTNRSIVNNIDLSTKGGMVWIKTRSTGGLWSIVVDTNRGATPILNTTGTAAASNASSTQVTSFNTDGFSLGIDSGNYGSNGPSYSIASWTFRKQPKFFDVVTYTGNGTAGRTVAHSLGSTPACIIVKAYSVDTGDYWAVYHRSLGATKAIFLSATNAAITSSIYWNNTEPTSTNFTVGDWSGVNQNGTSYVAYIFAHDAGGFGLTGTDNVISCGSYTADGTDKTISLGYEPQWVMVKRATNVGDWIMLDTMRNWSYDTESYLKANTFGAEDNGNTDGNPTATGFFIQGAGNLGVKYAGVNQTMIYIAIRRGPMKVPTSGTSVFSPVERAGTGTTTAITGLGFTPDIVIAKATNTVRENVWFDRLRGAGQVLSSVNTSSENADANALISFDMNGVTVGADTTYYSGINNNNVGQRYANWFMKRAPSFFDEVCYTGTGSANRQISHNLGVAPELVICKARNNGSQEWRVLSTALSQVGKLNGAGAFSTTNLAIYFGNDSTYVAPTSSVFTVGSAGDTNANTVTYVAYLFATCAGVSKVGSYTGNGSSQTINCGFTGGARFVLIRRTDSTGDWMISDSARGIVSGSDPYLELNNTNAEVTGEDWLDTDSTGFVVNEVSGSNANTSSATYIFLAIA